MIAKHVMAYIFILLIFAQDAAFSANRPYSKKHNGIIDDHHGILTDVDIERAEKDSLPATPFDGKNAGYPYWQCFHKRHLFYSCSYQKPLDREGSSLSIEIKTPIVNHSYSHPHAISGEVCDDMKRQLGRVLRQDEYFCINGTNFGSESNSDKRTYFWTFYRLKTKTGYVHYFQP